MSGKSDIPDVNQKNFEEEEDISVIQTPLVIQNPFIAGL